MYIKKTIATVFMALIAALAYSQSSFPPKSYPASIMVKTDAGVSQFWDVKRIMYIGPGNGGHKFRIYGIGAANHEAMGIDMFYLLPNNTLKIAGTYFFPEIKKGEAFNFDIVSAFNGHAPNSFLGFLIKDEWLQAPPQLPDLPEEVLNSIQATQTLPLKESEYEVIYEEVKEHKVNKIYDVDEVEIMASFPGGNSELKAWLSSNIRYPEEAVKKNIEGQVKVKFVVSKDGSVTTPVIIKSVDKILDREALRVVRKMPKWIPAKKGNKPVSSYFNLPINFRLR